MVEGKITSIENVGGGKKKFEVTYFKDGIVIGTDVIEAGSLAAEMVIKDHIRDKCSEYDNDVTRIGGISELRMGDVITGKSWTPKLTRRSTDVIS